MGTFVSQWRAWLVVPAGVGAVLVAVIAATTGTTAVASTALPGGTGTTGTSTTTTSTVRRRASRPAGPPVRVLLFGDSVALTLGWAWASPTTRTSTTTSSTTRGSSAAVWSTDPRSSSWGRATTRRRRAADRGSPHGGPAAERALADPMASAEISHDQAERGRACWRGAGRWSTASTRGSGRTFCTRPTPPTSRASWSRRPQLVTAAGRPHGVPDGAVHGRGRAARRDAWPEDNPARLAVYNKLVREVAAEHPTTDSAVDLFECGLSRREVRQHRARGGDPDSATACTSPRRGRVPGAEDHAAIVAAGRAQMAGATAAASAGG